MLSFRGVWSVLRFEWHRSLTPGRIAWWVVLAAFPIIMVALAEYNTRNLSRPLPPEIWSGFLFVLIPILVTMLGTFLWTAPAVAVELERKSWVYLAVRPHGRVSVLLGKYLAAIAWVLPAALIALSVSLLIADTGANAKIGRAILGLTLLAVPAYAALYLVIGTLFPKRSMVISVGYTLVFELLISFIPALINRLTLQYRLHGLLVRWTDLPIPDTGPAFSATQLIGNSSAEFLVITTIIHTLLLLVAAVIIVQVAEFSAAAESDV